MKGYYYIDLDSNIVHKTYEYINSNNPGFFSQNSHLIIKYGYFDTEDKNSMLRMLRSFTDLKVPSNYIHDFVKCINFCLDDLKTMI